MRKFHGYYSVGKNRLWGVVRRRKSAAHTLTALKSIRADRPDRAPIYIILDNLSAHRGEAIRRWAACSKVEPVLHLDLFVVQNGVIAVDARWC